MKPQNQLLGQLPLERVIPASAFEKVGVDYAGPFQVKCAHCCQSLHLPVCVSV